MTAKAARWALLAVLGLLALNALAYGSWFIVSPHEGIEEFGQTAASAGTLYLVGLVGVAMLDQGCSASHTRLPLSKMIFQLPSASRRHTD